MVKRDLRALLAAEILLAANNTASIMSKFLITSLCTIIAFLLSVISCIVSNLRLCNSAANEKEEDSSLEENDGGERKKEIPKISQLIKDITKKQWITAAVCTAVTSFACFRGQLFALNSVQTVKAVICCELVMCGAIIDLFTKKIPNKLNIVLYIAGLLMLGAEAVFSMDTFVLRLTSSVIGVAVGFGVLLVLSLLTKGGMGMGDVKLIGGVGLTMGITVLCYSLAYSMVLCLIGAVIMLLGKIKKLKDKIPFCPFFYAGLIISVSLGTF